MVNTDLILGLTAATTTCHYMISYM